MDYKDYSHYVEIIANIASNQLVLTEKSLKNFKTQKQSLQEVET